MVRFIIDREAEYYFAIENLHSNMVRFIIFQNLKLNFGM